MAKAESPQDSILDMANNIEPLYLDIQGLYRKWTRWGELWNEGEALREARAFAAHLAEAIESGPHSTGKYGPKDFEEAAEEMVKEWRSENPSMGESRVKWCPGSGDQGRTLRSNPRLDRCPVCGAVFVRYENMRLPLHKLGVGDMRVTYDSRGNPRYVRRHSQIDLYA